MFYENYKKRIILTGIAVFIGLAVIAIGYVRSYLSFPQEKVIWRLINYWQDDEEIVSFLKKNPENALPLATLSGKVPGDVSDEELLKLLKNRNPNLYFEIAHRIQFDVDAIESYSNKVDAFDDSHANVQLEVIRDEKGNANIFNIKYSVETAKEKGEGEFKFGNEDKTTCFSMANPWATMMYKNNNDGTKGLAKIESMPGSIYFVSYYKEGWR